MNRNLMDRLRAISIAMLIAAALGGCEQLTGGGDTTYTVTYDAQGGTPAPQTVTVNANALINPLPVVTKEGSTFQGWYTHPTEGVVFTTTTAVTGNLTLYAHWTANSVTYTVTYDAQGGTPAPQAVNVGANAVINPLPAVTKDGHTFQGWYTDATAGTVFTTTTAVTGNLTLYARWVVASGTTFTVTYDAQGGTPAPQAVNVAEGGLIDPLPVVTKDGHTFQGWYTQATEGTEFTTTTQVTAALTLYARWTAAYTVTYDAQGGTPAPQAVNVDANAVINPLPEVTKDGYTFQGWYTDATAGEVFTITTPVTAALTLYARWTAADNSAAFLKLHHDFADSRFANNQFTPAVGGDGAKASAVNSGWTRGSGTGGGKTFYYYKTGAKKAMNGGATYLDLGAGAGTILHDAADAYTIAAYVRIEGDTSGNGNFIWAFGETGDMGENNGKAIWFSLGSHTTSTGGWSTTQAVSLSPTPFTQNQWYHVAYTQNGTTGPDNAAIYIDGQEAARGTVTAIPGGFDSLVFNTLGGPPFAGDNNLSETMFTGFRIYNTALEAGQIAALAGDLTALKAVSSWTPAGYTVTFDSNSGGAVENPTSVIMQSGQTISPLPEPLRADYDFSGWYTNANWEQGTLFTTSTPVTAATTVYARWIAKPSISAASETTIDNSQSNLVDGDLSTLWTTNRLNQFYLMDLSFRDDSGNLKTGADADSTGLNGYRHWITIDLGQVVQDISKLEYYPREGGNVNQLIGACEIYASEDVNLKINIQRAITANKAKKVGGASGWDLTSSTGWRPGVIFTSDGSALTDTDTDKSKAAPVSARYIQLRVTGTLQGTSGTYQCAVGEIRLSTKTGGTETELTYPAGTQAYGDSHNADQRSMLAMQVIDGSTGTNWLTGNINVTTYFNQDAFTALKANLPADPHFDVGHWITLDLGAGSLPVSGLKYHRRSDNSDSGNFSGVEIYASDNGINPAAATNSGMSLVKTFTGLPIGTLNNVERWTLLDFGQNINKRYLHIRITGEIYDAPAGYGNAYNAGPNTGSESQSSTGGGQLGPRWGSAAAAEFTVVRN